MIDILYQPVVKRKQHHKKSIHTFVLAKWKHDIGSVHEIQGIPEKWNEVFAISMLQHPSD